jgi:ribosome-binding protein aMBF1 (putative translation factor)
MENVVDAIEDGRIVRVSRDYAVREGLLILRKPEPPKVDSALVKQQMHISPRLRGDRKIYADLDRFRKPLREKNDIKASLIENFHWILINKRKSLNLNRKQVSQSTGVSEEDIKNLELGLLPHNDYIAISRLENYFSINLRKNQNDIKMNAQSDVKPAVQNTDKIAKNEAENLISSDIELDEDFDK